MVKWLRCYAPTAEGMWVLIGELRSCTCPMPWPNLKKNEGITKELKEKEGRKEHQ